jgi:hypothetical protein
LLLEGQDLQAGCQFDLIDSAIVDHLLLLGSELTEVKKLLEEVALWRE